MNGNEAMAHRRLNETAEENASLADVYYNRRSVMENAMIDMEKLHDKITRLIVSHRYFEMHPIDVFAMTHQDILDHQKDARELYLNNPHFHATVQSIVEGILIAVEGCTTGDLRETL